MRMSKSDSYEPSIFQYIYIYMECEYISSITRYYYKDTQLNPAL